MHCDVRVGNSFSLLLTIDLQILIARPFQHCAGILEQSMGARNQVRIRLSYRPARLHGLAESIPELFKCLKIQALDAKHFKTNLLNLFLCSFCFKVFKSANVSWNCFFQQQQKLIYPKFYANVKPIKSYKKYQYKLQSENCCPQHLRLKNYCLYFLHIFTWNFATYSTASKSANSHIDFWRQNLFLIAQYYFLQTLKINAQKTTHKNRKDFYKRV
jgi:hypothetical protein